MHQLYHTCDLFTALTFFLKKAVAYKWLNVIAKVVEDINNHYTDQVNSSTHQSTFTGLLVIIITLLQNTLTL